MTKTVQCTLLALISATIWASPALAGCTKDTDCKGERVCEAGKCVTKIDEKPAPASEEPARSSESSKKPKAKAPDEAPQPKTKPAAASESPLPTSKNSTGGFALGAGAGYQTGLLGAVFERYNKIGNKAYLVNYAGLGVWPTDDTQQIGYCLGLMLQLGSRHRFVVDAAYGMSGVRTSTLSNGFGPVLSTTYEVLYGLTAAAGYEFMADSGFYLRTMLGGYYGFGALGTGLTGQVIALGFKFN